MTLSSRGASQFWRCCHASGYPWLIRYTTSSAPPSRWAPRPGDDARVESLSDLPPKHKWASSSHATKARTARVVPYHPSDTPADPTRSRDITSVNVSPPCNKARLPHNRGPVPSLPSNWGRLQHHHGPSISSGRRMRRTYSWT